MRIRVAPKTAAIASLTVPLLFAPMPAAADASLDWSISSISCTLTAPGGATSVVPCSTTQWSPSLQPGWSATISATVDYHYTDDGLPVAGAVLIDLTTGGFVPVTHESAGLYYFTQPACGRGGCTPQIPPALELSGATPLGAVFVSNNDVPDDITGSRTLSLTASLPAGTPYSWGGELAFAIPSATVVNSVPEPSTWALFGVSLATLAFVRRQRMAKT